MQNKTVHIATFSVRSLNRIGQLHELIDIVCKLEHRLQGLICHKTQPTNQLEHRYYHSELEIQYHDAGNR